MAKEPKADDSKGGNGASGEGELSKADVAKRLKGTVTDLVLDARGQPKMEKLPDGSKRHVTVSHPIGAADILDFKVRGDRITAVTIDGRKHEARV